MSLLGQRLREERESRGLALLQIELDTRIRANLIQALEEGNLNNLPPEPFLRGLLRTYAIYLRLDPKELLDLYVADTTPAGPASSNRPLIIQRPIAGPHPPATRPELEERPDSKPFSLQPQSPKPDGNLPEVPTDSHPPTYVDSNAPLPTEKRLFSRASSLVEPFKAIGRRLPLVPPSAKPPKPALRPANSEPPPSVPPETLPPPEFIAPVSTPIQESEPAPALEPQEELTPVIPEPVLLESEDHADEPVQPVTEPPAEPDKGQVESEAEKTPAADNEPIQDSVDGPAEPAKEPPQPTTTEKDGEIAAPPPFPGDASNEPIGQEIPVWVHVEPAAEKVQGAEAAELEKSKASRRKMKSLRVALIGVGAIILLGFFGFVAVIIGRILPDASSIATAQTPNAAAIVSTVQSPTVIGAIPTGIPTLAATAPPFSPVASVPTQAPTLKSTTPILPGTTNGVLNLDIQATQPMTAQIGIDGVMAYDGPIAPGTTVSYSAKDSLYILVENLVGGTVTFNNRKQVPLNFGERSVFRRQWTASSNGKITSVNPVAPSASKPVTPIPILNPLPSPTSLPSPTQIPATPSPIPSDTPKPSSTITPSNTPTRSGPTPTLTPFY